jgi:cell division protein ZapA
MGQVAVNLHGRLYRFDCGDGEEARLEELAAYLKGRIDALAQQYGNVGADRLMLAAALMITDELMDARAALAGRTGTELAGAEKTSSDKPKSASGEQSATAVGSGKGRAETSDPEPVRPDFRRKVVAAGNDA